MIKTALLCTALGLTTLAPALPATAASSPTRPAPSATPTTPPAGASTTIAPRKVSDVVRLDFDYLTEPDGDPVTDIRVTGSAKATGAVVTRGGGQVLAATSRADEGRAVSFPPFDPAEDAPRAVIRVLDERGPDQLSPKKRAFAFGADFVLDAVSSEAGSSDDGDNLVQRGLYDDAAQYKLQVDARHPSCRLKGTVGSESTELAVTSSVEVDDTHWYGAQCVRDGRTLQVVVTRFNDDGSSTTTTDSVESSKPIKLTMKPRSVPLSVGGKLYADGSVDLDSDQFNGVVDNAFLQVG